MNYNIYKTRQDIIQVLNNSQLPVGIGYYIIKDIYKELEDMYLQIARQEKQNKAEKFEMTTGEADQQES